MWRGISALWLASVVGATLVACTCASPTANLPEATPHATQSLRADSDPAKGPAIPPPRPGGCLARKQSDGCLTLELCGNATDDDCDGDTDESSCQKLDDYLEDWKHTGVAADYLVFGDYPLYAETRAGHAVEGKTWGPACVGQFDGNEKSEVFGCVGFPPDALQWQMTVPRDGYYVLMLGRVHDQATDHALEVNRGAGWESLPRVVSAKRVKLLDHDIAPAESIFYALKLPAGRVGFRVHDGKDFFAVTTAVLAAVKQKDHFCEAPVYPHLHFSREKLDAIRGGKVTPRTKKLLRAYQATADEYLAIKDFPARGRGREGVLEALAYSGLLNRKQEHLAKALELFMQQVRWIEAQDGVFSDILRYPYDLRQLGVALDVLHEHLSEEDRKYAKEVLSTELMRHALANLAGQWWRLPRQGGWTGSHAQAGQLSLALIDDDTQARLHLEVSLLMYKTTLRDNLSVDGAYLQALGAYYGWDFWNLLYFLSALDNNPGVTNVDLWSYNDQVLRKYTHWLVASLSPTRRCVGPFGAENCTGDYYADMISTFMLAARHYQDGVIRWFHDTLADSGHTLDLPLFESVVWADEQPAPVEPGERLPLGHVTRGNGHVFMRTGWGEGAMAYMSRCGMSGNHDQQEQGSFVLYADGHNYVQAYAGLDQGAPFEGNVGKNLVLIDGRGQTRAGRMDVPMGKVTAFIHSAAADYAVCDSTAAHNHNPRDITSMPVEHALRRTLFVRPDGAGPGYYVMADSVAARDGRSHRYEYLLHPGCRVQQGVKPGSCVGPIAVTPRGPGAYTFETGTDARLQVRSVLPKNAVHELQPAPVQGFPQQLRIRAPADGKLGTFVTVLFPEKPSAGRTMPKLTVLELSAKQSGFTLGADTWLWSQDGSPLSHDALRSDAAVVFRRGADKPRVLAMFDGTQLSHRGVEYLRTSERQQAVIQWSGDGMRVDVGNNEVATAPGELRLGGLPRSTSLKYQLDGAAQPELKTDAKGVVTISGLSKPRHTIVLQP